MVGSGPGLLHRAGVASLPIGETKLAYEIVPEGAGSLLIAFSGELDLSVAADMRACLAHAEVLEAPGVQIDLGEVTFIDSSCIGVLLAACKTDPSVRWPALGSV